MKIQPNHRTHRFPLKPHVNWFLDSTTQTAELELLDVPQRLGCGGHDPEARAVIHLGCTCLCKELGKAALGLCPRCPGWQTSELREALQDGLSASGPVAANEQMCSELSAQKGSCTWAGRAKAAWGSAASALPPAMAPGQPGLDSSLFYQLQPVKGGQSLLLAPILHLYL